MQCFESRFGKFLRRLRMNHSSNGQIKWQETLQSAIKTSTAITIRNRDILQKIVGPCGIIWTSLFERAKLKSLLHHSNGQGNQTNSNSKKNAHFGPPLGIINVVFTAPWRTGSCPSRVMLVVRFSVDENSSELKRAKVLTQPTLGFSDEDKAGTIQPHDDALVVTLRIEGYDVR